MRDRTIVVAFFGLIVAIGLFSTATGLGAALGLMVLFIVGIILALEPRDGRNSQREEDVSGRPDTEFESHSKDVDSTL